jgi:hypothetical protein
MTPTAGSKPSSVRSAIAVALTRIVIPLWLTTGAVLKLIDGSPSNLPAAIVKWVGGHGVDLRFVLESSIAVEFVVAGVMVLLPGLARLVGILMLGAFLPILIGDVALGATSCGCFGAVQMSPWITLATDVFFLAMLVVVAHGVPSLKLTATLPTWRVVAVGLWAALSVAVAFGLTAASEPGEEGTAAVVAAAGPQEGYYLPDYASWVGQPFRSIEIAAWIRDLPGDLDLGSQYLLFYRLDCEHCHELMEVFFAGEPPLPTTAVAVPERNGFPSDGIQPFVCGECRLAELPAGYDWFLQTPVLVRLTNGVVICAAEVTAEDPVCLDVY